MPGAGYSKQHGSACPCFVIVLARHDQIKPFVVGFSTSSFNGTGHFAFKGDDRQARGRDGARRARAPYMRTKLPCELHPVLLTCPVIAVDQRSLVLMSTQRVAGEEAPALSTTPVGGSLASAKLA